MVGQGSLLSIGSTELKVRPIERQIREKLNGTGFSIATSPWVTYEAYNPRINPHYKYVHHSTLLLNKTILKQTDVLRLSVKLRTIQRFHKILEMSGKNMEIIAIWLHYSGGKSGHVFTNRLFCKCNRCAAHRNNITIYLL